MNPRLLTLLGLLGPACTERPDDVLPAACESLCDELVATCALETFPDRDACLGGCAYEHQEGADIEGYAACAAEAACDPFAIVACEASHGLY